MSKSEVAIAGELVMVPITKIKPYLRNPRINDATIDQLVELIPKVGFNVPLVLDRDNVIVKGHSRWKAGIRLGMKKLPCLYSDADPETIKLDRLADNRVQEFSQWELGFLQEERAALGTEFDLVLGMFDDLMPAVAIAPVGDNASVAAAPAEQDERELVVCNHCGARFHIDEEEP